jgi:hypothetical protein
VDFAARNGYTLSISLRAHIHHVSATLFIKMSQFGHGQDYTLV